MNIESKVLYISAQTIECCLWAIQRYLMDKYGVDESYHEIAPLAWYINTGRASVDFIRKLINAKPFMVARKLHMGGSYDEAVQRVKDYLQE